MDPSEVIRRYAAETEAALADGYRGLRASADVTDIVRTAEQQAAFCRYEFLIDRYLSQHPLSAMCAYRTELGDAVQRFACLHPAATGGLTSFHVYACDDGAVGLAGEAELSCLPELERAVEHLSLAAIDRTVVVDLSRLTFVDHRALLALAAFAPLDPVTDPETLIAQTMLVHEWRRFPFLDPGLPPDLLPPGWPGADAAALFRARHERWRDGAARCWARLAGQDTNR